MVLWQNLLAHMLYLLTYCHVGANEPVIYKVFIRNKCQKDREFWMDTTLTAFNPVFKNIGHNVFSSHLDLNIGC